MIEIRCVVDAKAQLGESTYWDPMAGVLWWIDIYGPIIHRFDPKTNRTESFEAPEYLGCIAVRASGGLVVSMKSGFLFFDPANARFDPIADPEAHLPDTRFNDGKTDRQGRFWSGSMFEAPGKPPVKSGALYRLDTDLSWTKIIDGVGCSNVLAWSPDNRTMYFADSHTPFVWAYDFDPASGSVANPRVFLDLSDINGIVDGSTVDADGCYWTTIPFQSMVRQYDPVGKLMRTIELPTDLPTCCEFGGPDLDVLYVTTAIYRRTPTPHAGGLFALEGLGAKGLPLVPFAG
jgi:L-arabinonolactonase